MFNKEISFLLDGDTDGIANPSLGTEAIVGAGKARCDVAGVIVLPFSGCGL